MEKKGDEGGREEGRRKRRRKGGRGVVRRHSPIRKEQYLRTEKETALVFWSLNIIHTHSRTLTGSNLVGTCHSSSSSSNGNLWVLIDRLGSPRRIISQLPERKCPFVAAPPTWSPVGPWTPVALPPQLCLLKVTSESLAILLSPLNPLVDLGRRWIRQGQARSPITVITAMRLKVTIAPTTPATVGSTLFVSGVPGDRRTPEQKTDSDSHRRHHSFVDPKAKFFIPARNSDKGTAMLLGPCPKRGYGVNLV